MPEKEFVLNADGPQTLYEFVQEQLKDLDTTELSDDVSQDPEVEITPEKSSVVIVSPVCEEVSIK